MLRGGVVALPGSGVAHTKTAIDSHSLTLSRNLKKREECNGIVWSRPSPAVTTGSLSIVWSLYSLLQSFTFPFPSLLLLLRRTVVPASCCLLLGSAPGWHTLLASAPALFIIQVLFR